MIVGYTNPDSWLPRRHSLPSARKAARPTIFDRGAATRVPTPAVVAVPPVFGAFRQTERDRRPVKEVVTGRLMGDPAPDRVVPETPAEAKRGPEQDPAPVYLTFRDYEAALRNGTYGRRET